jgi:ribosome-associated heat shock protein Hsp15
MSDCLRIDKWLWFARFFKSRSLAASVVEAGEVRLNGAVATKAAQVVKLGDELIFPTGPKWRRVRVVALGHRRGPAPEAQALYLELSPPPPPPEDA